MLRQILASEEAKICLSKSSFIIFWKNFHFFYFSVVKIHFLQKVLKKWSRTIALWYNVKTPIGCVIFKNVNYVYLKKCFWFCGNEGRQKISFASGEVTVDKILNKIYGINTCYQKLDVFYERRLINNFFFRICSSLLSLNVKIIGISHIEIKESIFKYVCLSKYKRTVFVSFQLVPLWLTLEGGTNIGGWN